MGLGATSQRDWAPEGLARIASGYPDRRNKKSEVRVAKDTVVANIMKRINASGGIITETRVTDLLKEVLAVPSSGLGRLVGLCAIYNL